MPPCGFCLWSVGEWAALSGQYEREQKRQAEQVTRLEEQVRQLAGQCSSLENQMRRLAEQYEQERKAHKELTSLLGEHIEHVGKLSDNYKALTDDLTELFR